MNFENLKIWKFWNYWKFIEMMMKDDDWYWKNKKIEWKKIYMNFEIESIDKSFDLNFEFWLIFWNFVLNLKIVWNLL